MVTPANRFKGWIDSLADDWKDRLRGWMASWLGFGIELFFDILGKAAAPKLKPFIDTLEATGKVPPELQPLLDELKLPTGQAGAMFANSAGSALIGGALGKIIDAIFLPIAYAVNRVTRNVILSPGQLLSLWHRDEMPEDKVNEYLSWLGYEDEDIEHWKLLSWFLPGPMDLVNWQAKEVFEPEMIARYGLDDEFEGLRHEDFRKVGVTPEHERNYWRAHWQHASYTQVIEMMHRGELTEAEAGDWFRLVEIPPFWRAKLIATAWNIPNRIEIRMMARYLDMSKAEIEALLTKAGLAAEFRPDAADFMMIMGLTGYWADMLSKGWMNPNEVKADIDSRGFKPVTAERLYKRLVKANQPEKVEKARELTVAMIIRWVKLDEPSRRDQGIELLVDLRYTQEQADFIMEGYLGDMGSPETFDDFKNLTTKYRRAIGMEAKPMSDEIIEAGAEVVKLTKDIEALNLVIKDEESGLIKDEAIPEAASARRDELRVALHRAESELAAAKVNYDSLVAEWRHKSAT